MTVQKQRESNIELFRIITMLLIVAHHYVVNSGLMDVIQESEYSGRMIFYLLFGAWGKAGINCFVLITGYFMCRSEATIRKFLKLYLEVLFYCVVIYLIFILVGVDSIGAGRVMKALMPIRIIKANFTGCFLVFFMLIPFLNRLLTTLDRKTHFLLIAVTVFAYCVLGTLEIVQSEAFGVTLNYVSWFIVLYFIGAYFQYYGAGRFEKHTGAKLLVCIAFSVASIVLIAFHCKQTNENIYKAYTFVSDSNKLFALLIAIYAFLFFKNLRIGYSPIVNKIAASTFGVLLIHANSAAMRNWLWGTILHVRDMYHAPQAVFHAFASVLVVYIVCTMIDMLRIRFLERPFFRWYDQNEARMLQAGRNYLEKAYNYVNQGGVNNPSLASVYS